MTRISRRALLATGAALVVHFSTAPSAQAADAGVLPGALATLPQLSGWVRIDAEGKITVFTGKCELGQGIRTALIQIAAEQLDVQPADIHLVTADTARTANEGYTSGSLSMKNSGTAVLNATAEVRALLVQEAAVKLGVAEDKLVTTGGAVVAPDGRKIGYGALAQSIAPDRKASGTAKLKDPKTHRISGKYLPRVDIPAKMTGGAAFIHDMRLPGMLHARMIRPPSYGATLKSLDPNVATSMPGVKKVVRDGSFIAVIADREWQAIQAMRALEANATWNAGRELPEKAKIYDIIRGLTPQDTTILDRSAPIPDGAKRFKAQYRRPYKMHGSIGPSCAIGLMEGDQLTVWTHTQGVFPDRAAIADLLKMPPPKVRLIHVEGAGCYGHNGADDAAADAAMLARAMPGTPIRVQWTREQEQTWEPFTPAMVTEVEAALDDNGRVVDWQYGVWSNTHSNRPGNGGSLIAAWHIAEPLTPPVPKPIPQPEGGGDRNGIPLYVFPNAKVVSHFLLEEPLRVSAQRGLGAYANVFTIESFMDELAEAAKVDPVAFRLAHLADPRAKDVINLAAERFGWATYQSKPNHGRGFAFARYKNLGAYLAIALEVSVDRDTGLVRLLRAEAAVDSGEVVSHDGIVNQTQGGIVQSSSWTLLESVTYDRARITSRDWRGYPIMRFAGVPEAVNVHVIDRPGEAYLGTGEAAAGPTAAALGNAVQDAIGKRLRELPLSAERVKGALSA
jgi:CO/xanthine dehydrogenase Mo-binding subunit